MACGSNCWPAVRREKGDPHEETVGLADPIVYRTGLCALKLEAFAPGSECVGSSSENRWELCLRFCLFVFRKKNSENVEKTNWLFAKRY